MILYLDAQGLSPVLPWKRARVGGISNGSVSSPRRSGSEPSDLCGNAVIHVEHCSVGFCRQRLTPT